MIPQFTILRVATAYLLACLLVLSKHMLGIKSNDELYWALQFPAE